MTIQINGESFSTSRCKFCPEDIMWPDRTFYISSDGEWQNYESPKNLDGREHRCEGLRFRGRR